MRELLLRHDTTLPLVISPESRSEQSGKFLAPWLRKEHHTIEAKLQRSGAVLFRGFDLSTASQFQEVAQSFQPELRNYIEGQSPRRKIIGKIYNSTSYPPSETITLHNELSYKKHPPRYLFFFCATPPAEMGETPIVDCRMLLKVLPPEVLEPFRNHRILYVCKMHGGQGFGKSWQEGFETEDRKQVESYLSLNDIHYEWLPNNTLQTRHICASISVHPETREEVWFNQATLWHFSNLGDKARMLSRLLGEDNLPMNAYFENGQRIDDHLLEEVRQVTWNEATFFPWQRGDVLFIDNYLVAHGRNRYSGDRLILVAMG